MIPYWRLSGYYFFYFAFVGAFSPYFSLYLQSVGSTAAQIAVLMSLIGAFYYLRVVKVMYFDAPTQTASIEAPADARAVLSINGLLVLILGIVPSSLMTLCSQAIAGLFR